MLSIPYRLRSSPQRIPLSRRTISLALAILIHVLMLLMLLRQVPDMAMPADQKGLMATFTLSREPAAEKKKAATKEKSESKEQPRRAEREQVTLPTTPKPEPEKPKTPDLPFVQMSSADLASADISRMPSRADSGGSTSGTGTSSAAAYGPGEGPGGVQLFDAEWYRRPTHAELSTYVPANAPRTGWGMVACKTVDAYHVENCQQIGESPLGSGFARAVRQAAWQFLVRPPRIDGKPQVGSWVRIRIDYTETPAPH